MTSRTLNSSPSILPLYVRAAAPMIPGASLLPFIPGGGGEIPEIELELLGARAEPERVAAYAKVCGFTLRDQLPPIYPHVLAFPLQMAVMADGSFPFGAVGLVHLENRIATYRPIETEEELTIRVRPTPLRPHPKGQAFGLETEALADGEPVWESVSTMLRRGTPPTAPGATSPAFPETPPATPGASPPADVVVPSGMREEVRRQGWAQGRGPGLEPERAETEEFEPLPADAPASAKWRLGGDLGRRYGGVSGDRNPIHMHSLTAKPLGFPAAIAHGMWTKARALAALESRLPDAFEVDVRFRKPILLPARVEFASASEDGETRFAVRDATRGKPHLDGRVRPLEPEPKAKNGKKRGK